MLRLCKHGSLAPVVSSLMKTSEKDAVSISAFFVSFSNSALSVLNE